MQTTQGKCTNVQYKNTKVNVQWRQRIGKCSRQTKQYRERIGKCRIQQQQQQQKIQKNVEYRYERVKCIIQTMDRYHRVNAQYKNTEVNVQFRQQRDTCTLDNTEVILNLQLINKTSRPDFYRLQHDL